MYVDLVYHVTLSNHSTTFYVVHSEGLLSISVCSLGLHAQDLTHATLCLRYLQLSFQFMAKTNAVGLSARYRRTTDSANLDLIHIGNPD